MFIFIGFGFTFFIQMLGRLGDLELAASNIVLPIETLGFIPMVGFHIGNATLVGQAIGRGGRRHAFYHVDHSSALIGDNDHPSLSGR